MEDIIWFRNICRKNVIQISDLQIDQLDKFHNLLLGWNGKINLISRKNSENIWSQHIFASISFQNKFIFHDRTLVLDLGTGGGLPGIPLAILRPDIQFTLLDSIRKKMKAVEDIVSTLNLTNVETVCGRAEEVSKLEKYRNKFDYVISRAVAPVKDIIKWGAPFLGHTKGAEATASGERNQVFIKRYSLVMLKGGELSMEIEEAKNKCKPLSIEVFPIPIDGIEETHLVDKKLVIVKP